MLVIEEEKDADIFIETYRKNPEFLVFDTETTGLSAYMGSVPFSVQFLIPDKDNLNNHNLFLFQLHPYDGEENIPKTPPSLFKKCMTVLMEEGSGKTKLIAHNIKFDLHMMHSLGVFFSDMQLHDTEVFARLFKNNLPQLSLGYLTKTFLPKQFHKDDAVKTWLGKPKNKKISHTCKISKNKKRMEYSPLYGKVPADIMIKYGIQDVVSTWELYRKLQYEVAEYAKHQPQYHEKFLENFRVECEFTKVLFDMEKRGILVDADYVDKAISHEQALITQCKKEYVSLTGEEYFDSDVTIQRLFRGIYNIELPLGEPTAVLKIRSPKTDSETLESTGTPLAELILKIRKREKRLSTYFLNIKENMAENDCVLHPSFRQVGATTLRMSSSGGLNIQNLPARGEDKEEFPVRKCFIPRSGYKLCSIDYSAQEVRVILDLSGEMGAIEKILGGEDPHKANAEIAGCSRTQAKTVIFSILYGSGTELLAAQLGTSCKEAEKIKNNILRGLPHLKRWTQNTIDFAKKHGITHNCFGVRYHWDGAGEKFFKAVNYAIQGASAGITKRGGLAIRRLTQEEVLYKDVHMLAAVHDEFLFEIPEHFTEADCMPIAEAMCTGYVPKNGLYMEAEPEIMEYAWKK